MSGDGSIELTWADELRPFRITIGEFRKLQESVNARRVLIGAAPIGPSALLHQLRTSNAWPDDIRDVLKAGLLGAGASPADINRLLVRHFDGSPALEHSRIAFLVLMAALVGVPDDDPESKKKTQDQMNPSDSRSSTDTGPQ